MTKKITRGVVDNHHSTGDIAGDDVKGHDGTGRTETRPKPSEGSPIGVFLIDSDEEFSKLDDLWKNVLRIYQSRLTNDQMGQVLTVVKEKLRSRTDVSTGPFTDHYFTFLQKVLTLAKNTQAFSPLYHMLSDAIIECPKVHSWSVDKIEAGSEPAYSLNFKFQNGRTPTDHSGLSVYFNENSDLDKVIHYLRQSFASLEKCFLKVSCILNGDSGRVNNCVDRLLDFFQETLAGEYSQKLDIQFEIIDPASEPGEMGKSLYINHEDSSVYYEGGLESVVPLFQALPGLQSFNVIKI